LLLELFADPPVKRLTYGQLAELIGFSPAAVASWPKRDSIPKEAEMPLVDVAQKRGVSGVTVLWLKTGAGALPQKTGLTTHGGLAPPERPLEADALEEIVRRPDVFTRRMMDMREVVGPEAVLAYLEDYERIVTEKEGPRFRAFFKAVRNKVRSAHRRGAGGDPAS
jgi:hypothetical protein